MKTQALVRRFLAVLSVAALAVGLAMALGSSSASAAPVKGFLSIVSFTDTASGLGAPVRGQGFNVTVRVLDAADQPTTVSRATTVRLTEVSGPGTLEGTTSAVILRGGSGVTISGAIYSEYANGVVFAVSAVSGVDLEPHDDTNPATVNVAATAVGANASANNSLNLKDPNCVAPTADLPTCGSQLFLPNGADGRVTMSVNACEGLRPQGCRSAGRTEALIVTAAGAINGLYPKNEPAALILACDKDLCGQSAAGLPQLPIVFALSSDDPSPDWEPDPAPACPAKGVLGENQSVCVDYVQSSRKQGDLYTYILFDRDPRFSHP